MRGQVVFQRLINDSRASIGVILCIRIGEVMRILLICCLMVALAALASSSLATDAPKPDKVRIVLVGDSTVTDKSGWGLAFAALLKPDAECVNAARSGSSSKSYYDSGSWKQALSQQAKFVLIQFGHNDQPGKGPERETDPKTSYRENLIRYVDQARQAGAQPILVTSMARRTFRPDGKITSSLTPYVDAMKAVAADKKVPFVDLHARSIALFESVGAEKSKAFGPPHPNGGGQVDGTHLSAEGAKAIAPLVVDELWKAEPALRHCLPGPKT
ncbi:MAG: Pectinesterase [Planctomycetaceae bacterium]|nr:Pectinesterase [Planctomycetaceae bacterium]